MRSISKGNVESGDLLACALREFGEETSLTPIGPFVVLAPVRQKSGKMIHAFAVEADFDLRKFSSNLFEVEWPPRSRQKRNFPEIDRVGYFGVAQARRKILPGQCAFIDELIVRLRQQ